MTAALGMAAGMGPDATAVLGTLPALFILSALQRVGRWLGVKVGRSGMR